MAVEIKKKTLQCSSTATSAVKLEEPAVGKTPWWFSVASNKQSRLRVPKGHTCSCQVALFIQSLLKQQSIGHTELILGSEESVSMSQHGEKEKGGKG